MVRRSSRRLRSLNRQLTSSAAVLPQLSLSEVSQHCTRSSCWVVLWNKVYDFTAFLEAHPGGARAILRNAGGDATATFQELHSDAIFHAFVNRYLIGTLLNSECFLISAPSAPIAAIMDSPPTDSPKLDSPFPHSRFDGTGLECVRFTWYDADLTRGYFAEGRSSSPTAPELSHVHRQKSGLSPLAEENWLALGSPAEYAQNMNLKKQLLSRDSPSGHMCYISEPSAIDAEREVLHDVLAFVATHHPDRFDVNLSSGIVRTMTPGYEHCFLLADYDHDPLRLVGQLVQEDFFLLVEEESVWDPDGHEYQVVAGGMADATNDGAWRPQSPEEWAEMHPSGKQHTFNAAASCFSFDPRPKHLQDMSVIHHPGVGGWVLYLQRGMNRLFSAMTHHGSDSNGAMDPRSVGWYRHNFGFNLVSGRTGSSLSHEMPWAPFVDSEARRKKQATQDFAANSLEGRPVMFPGLSDVLAQGGKAVVGEEVALHIEFQTLRRLASSNYILFTVRSYANKMVDVARYPAASQALAAAIRRKYKAGWLARGFAGEVPTRALLEFLDDAAATGGLEPGLRGRVAEPWERIATEDGTGWREAERKVAAVADISGDS